jgi:probable rRNA maturation factor
MPAGEPHQRAARSPLRVVIGNASGRPVRTGGLASWLVRIAPAGARGIVSVAILSDARVRALNRQYRGTDRATDVLSFPSTESPARRRRAASRLEPPTSGPRFLGEVVIARGVAARQARAAGHSAQTEWRVLALHGLLHLLGYDHERDAGRMARLERRLRRKGGLREGLIDRRRRPRRARAG